MCSGERKLRPSRVKEVVLVIVKPAPVRDMRRGDQQALEEIRRLFARYRQVARHGQATERHEPPEARRDDAKEPAAPPGR
jgi:hypothetical protein